MKAILKIALITLVVAIASQILLAAAPRAGKISGFVCDTEGNSIPGATVRIEGTSIGASSNLDGSYAILNVPQGVHTVISYCIFYSKETIRDLSIKADSTTFIDFILSPNFNNRDVMFITKCVDP